jgi:hypothetical protein
MCSRPRVPVLLQPIYFRSVSNGTKCRRITEKISRNFIATNHLPGDCLFFRQEGTSRPGSTDIRLTESPFSTIQSVMNLRGSVRWLWTCDPFLFHISQAAHLHPLTPSA